MRNLVLLLMTALVAGCATSPREPVPAGRVVDAALVTSWVAKGRLAVAVDDKGGSGSFRWTQRSEATELEVRGPLGVGALRILTDGQGVSVADGDGQPVDAEAARAAIQARLGADLPLAEMRYWMLGVPAPGSAANVAAGPAGSVTVEQSGWSVAYEPHTVVEGWSVPTRLTATRAPVRIKVLVDEWTLPPAGVAP